jgi:hypothetical protein
VLILLVALQYLGIINMNGILKHIGLSPVIDCADDAAVKLTLRLFNEQILTEEYSSEMVSLMKARLDLDSIRTMAMDKNAGRCVCRTDLIIKNPYNESESTVPIEYATYKVKEGMLVEGKTLSRLNL